MPLDRIHSGGVSVDTNRSLENLRILVVDDNSNMRRLIRAVIHGFGCREVVEAGDGADALEILESSPVDIIITDYLMDPLDGIDLIRMLRDEGAIKNPYVPIILLTGASHKDVIERARDAGVTEILTKPISAAQLWTRLAAVVDRPRPYIRAQRYFGPDRRRRAKADYEGPQRREDDEKSESA